MGSIQNAEGINGHSQKLIPPRLYSIKAPPSLSDFKKLCSQTWTNENLPLASSVQSSVPIYNISDFSLDDSTLVDHLQDEWHHILLSGPGVFIIKSLYPDKDLLNSINATFASIIHSEATSSNSKKGDHFSPSTTNSRIWNSFLKHAITSPSTFIPYYSSSWLSSICSAWLGPAYRITAQVNLVRPSGPAQTSHRDYHLGFQTSESCSLFPRPMHSASQHLTLQGAVAMTDMPLSSGPTRFLPFSQIFAEGFMAYRLENFQNYFNKNYVTSPLEAGDAVFFNPAIFHAAGENMTSDFERSANLLQVSSAFGKTMESLDSIAVIKACWEELLAKRKNGDMAKREVEAFMMAVADGYPFPTNLDRRPPAPGGMAPESEVEMLVRGVNEGWGLDKVVGEMEQMRRDGMAL